MYAQLLMRAITGSLCQENPSEPWIKTTTSPNDDMLASDQPYDIEAQQPGRASDHSGRHARSQTQNQHRRMVGRKHLENIYEALRVTLEEGVHGDFVDVGDWRGDAAIFAAGVVRQLGFNCSVWVLGRSGQMCVCVCVCVCVFACVGWRLAVYSDC